MNKVAQFRACLHINGKWKAKLTHRAFGFVFTRCSSSLSLTWKKIETKHVIKHSEESWTLTHEAEQLAVLLVFGEHNGWSWKLLRLLNVKCLNVQWPPHTWIYQVAIEFNLNICLKSRTSSRLDGFRLQTIKLLTLHWPHACSNSFRLFVKKQFIFNISEMFCSLPPFPKNLSQLKK